MKGFVAIYVCINISKEEWVEIDSYRRWQKIVLFLIWEAGWAQHIRRQLPTGKAFLN